MHTLKVKTLLPLVLCGSYNYALQLFKANALGTHLPSVRHPGGKRAMEFKTLTPEEEPPQYNYSPVYELPT